MEAGRHGRQTHSPRGSIQVCDQAGEHGREQCKHLTVKTECSPCFIVMSASSRPSHVSPNLPSMTSRASSSDERNHPTMMLAGTEPLHSHRAPRRKVDGGCALSDQASSNKKDSQVRQNKWEQWEAVEDWREGSPGLLRSLSIVKSSLGSRRDVLDDFTLSKLEPRSTSVTTTSSEITS
eukprot:695800-Hanusia_phi.AAC.3